MAVASTLEAPVTGRMSVRADVPTQRATASYGRLPLHFEANRGQTDQRVKFLARGSGYSLFLTPTESVLVLRKAEATRPGQRSSPPAVLRMKLLGADPRPAIEGKDELPGKSNYFIGNDPRQWLTDVPQYARVEYKDVYPGVSLTYYGNQNQLEYDFVVSPRGDLTRIRLGIEGAEELHVNAEGNLVLSLPGGEVVEKAPVVYQEFGKARKAIEGRFVLRGRGEVGFEVSSYEADRPLVLDPLLVYSTYLGGNSDDQGLGIAVDVSGNAYVTGFTASTNFPTANPLQAAYAGGFDAFVAKLNAAGSALVYSTYLGGSDTEFGYGIAVDTSGNAYVTGLTTSPNFPTANPYQAANGGFQDAFVAKLNPAGSALIYSTYLGGSGDDFGRGIAVDVSGNAYVTGFTTSTNFPTANPLQAANGGSGGTPDAFVAKLNAAGSTLAYSTYLGGSDVDIAFAIAVDASGNAYVTGNTVSTNFPTANPLQAANGGGFDAFVAKLNALGSALVYSTYLGGSGNDQGLSIAVDASGNTYLTGYTTSTNFPTASPLQAASGGGFDAFVSKLNAAGSTLVYSTYLGGSAQDQGLGIAVDASGNAYVTGFTASTNFPTASPLQAVNRGSTDTFVARLNAAGSALIYSTYLGGSRSDFGLGIAVDASGNAYVTGYTDSADFPTANPLQAAWATGTDAFVARFDLLADLSITKTDGQTTAGAGNSVTYAIAVTNGGPDPATGATVTDTFPTALTGVTWMCSASAGSSCGIPNGSGNLNQTVNLLVGGTVTFTAAGTLNINASGTLSNRATVTPPAGITDPNLANNSATDTDTIIPAADLSITKTDGQTTVSTGQALTYTIVASNAGPTAVSGATVSDTVPAALNGVAWTCAGVGGGTCTAVGAGNINDTVNLPVGATVTYILSATVSLTASTFSNIATVTPPNTVNDPNLANNTATDTDIVTCGSIVVIVPDGRLTEVTVASGAMAWFGATVKIGDSYSVDFKNTTGGMPPGTVTVFKGDDSCGVGSTLTTNDTHAIDPSGTGGLTRASFTATGTQSFYQAKLVNTTGGPVTLTFGWSDTTQFSAAWSTNGSFDTYYSLQNTTGTALSGTLTLLDTSGAMVTTVAVSVPAGQTVGANTVSLGVTRNRTGTASFTHNGPPGAILVEAAIANFTISPAYVQPVRFQATREAR